MFRNLLWSLCLALFLCFPAYAKPALKASLSAPKISIDQTLELLIEVEWPKSEAVYAFAFPKIPLTNFTIVREGQSQESFKRGEEDWVKKSFAFELKPTQKGTAAVQAFDLPYIDPILQKAGRASVPRLEAAITSEPLSQSQILALSIGAAGTFFAGALFFLIRGKRKKEADEKAAAITPQEAAARKFKSLVEAAEARDRKDMLHEIGVEFREFLAESYQLAVKNLTDAETLSTLKKKNVSIEEREKIEKIFKQLQETKFMGAAVTADNLRLLQREILQFIESKKVYGNP